MKNILILFTLITFITTGAFSLTGRDIMQMVEDRNSPESLHGLLELTIKEANDSVKTRIIELWSVEDNEDLSKTIMVFRAPSAVKNTRFLTQENDGADDDQWIFLPALGKVRRIASSDGDSSFMGTEFTYDDMSSREIDDYTYQYLTDETVDGYDCYVVESIPKDLSDNQYSKTTSWVVKDKDIIRPIKMNLYNKKGELEKVLTVEELEQIDGYWISTTTTMTNLLNNRSSTIKNKKIEVDKKTNPAVFGKRFLTTGKVR